MDEPEASQKPLPPPWDRIFSLCSRMFVWGLIGAIIYLLRPFFLLLFLTFVFAYIQAHGVDGLAHRFAKRWVRVVTVFLVFLGTLVAIGFFLVPHIEAQIENTTENYTKWIEAGDKGIKDFAKSNEFLKDRITEDFTLRKVVEDLLGLFAEPVVSGSGVQDPAPDRLQPVIEFLQEAANWILFVGSTFFMALLFSFLIVLDLPKLTRGVRGLANTKIGFIHNEVAGSIYSFCKTLGRAMEAQLIIAIANTIFTAIGLMIIDVGSGNMVFLCTVVFFCSFIPVAGVFISSTPICLVALGEHGLSAMFLVVVMITVIHMLEAYVLNPQIYGHHLRMNPVLTLIILVICGKLFGPWGLILGIPVVNYVFKDAIRHKPDEAEEKSPPQVGTA